jgi:hypothetical protein
VRFSDALLHKKTKNALFGVSPFKPGFNSLRACVCVCLCVYINAASAQRKNFEERTSTEEEAQNCQKIPISFFFFQKFLSFHPPLNF